MGELPDFNRERIAVLFGNDLTICKQVLDILKDDLPSHLDQLSESIGEQDSRQIYKTAHTLKGTLANVGADRGSSLAQRMVLASQENNFEYCRKLYESLVETTETFLAEFQELAFENT